MGHTCVEHVGGGTGGRGSVEERASARMESIQGSLQKVVEAVW